MAATEASKRIAEAAMDAGKSDPSKSTTEMPQAGKNLALALAITLGGGIMSSMIGNPLSPWYANLYAPWWQPPGPVFAAAWSALYAAMGLASWLVYRQGGFPTKKLPLAACSVQLAFNLLWPIIAFANKDLTLALCDIWHLVTMSYRTWRSFVDVNPIVGWNKWPMWLISALLDWVYYPLALSMGLGKIYS